MTDDDRRPRREGQRIRDFGTYMLEVVGRIIALEHRMVPLERVVYGLVALVLIAFITAVLALVLRAK